MRERSYLKDLQEFLFEMHEYGYFDIDMQIDSKSTKTEYEAGNAKGYCIKNRPFSDVEIKILCDSILFSPGMTDDQAKKLIRKIGLLSGDEFNNVYKYVHVSNIVQKTDNTEVVNNIEIIGDAISKGAKVSFTYKNEDIKISPYYLVVYGGRYYCIGNNDTNHVEVSCDGVVKVGYNLSDITVNVDNYHDVIYIQIPEANITNNYIIMDSVKTNDENNIFNPINYDQYDEIFAEIKKTGLEEAINKGVYEKAEDNLKKLLYEFYQNLMNITLNMCDVI